MALHRGESEPLSFGCTLRLFRLQGLHTACGPGPSFEMSFAAAYSQGLCSLEGLPVWWELFLLTEGDGAGQTSSCLS